MSSLPLLLEPETLASLTPEQREGILLVDVCQTTTYQRMHIPGAVHVPPSSLVCGVAPAAGRLPTLEQLNRLFSSIGYCPDRHIIVYDDEGGGWAGRFLWTLDVIGHHGASVLNGGLHAWAKEGHPLESEATTAEMESLSLTLNEGPIAEIDDILSTLDDPRVKIWDARSAEEYLGLKMTALRNGHIPGAVNLDWLELMDHSRNLRLLPDEILQGKLSDLGITPGNRIITHCHSHHRSGLSYLVARHLGYPVKAYHGSWSEWGNRPDTPVEEGAAE